MNTRKAKEWLKEKGIKYITFYPASESIKMLDRQIISLRKLIKSKDLQEKYKECEVVEAPLIEDVIEELKEIHATEAPKKKRKAKKKPVEE